jgi:SagB-type dehydrogenase family enzyme
MGLTEALRKRRSARRFDGRPLSREELAYLLWAGNGVNRAEEKKRTAPSAWEAYAISIYVTSPAGTSIYDPVEHSLRPAGGPTVGGPAQKDLRAEIPRAEGTRAAPVVLVLVADFSRYPARASQESRRFLAHADCGAIAENVYLAATALGLGTVITADARPESQALLGLSQDQLALYVMPVGHPAAGEAAQPPAKEGQRGKN